MLVFRSVGLLGRPRATGGGGESGWSERGERGERGEEAWRPWGLFFLGVSLLVEVGAAGLAVAGASGALDV